MGMGPMTGRGAGYCGGAGGAPFGSGFMSRMCGAFLGQGRGRGGRGWRAMFYATGLTGRQRAAGGVAAAPPTAAAAPTSDAAWQALHAEIGAVQVQLNDLKKRLARLDAGQGQPAD